MKVNFKLCFLLFILLSSTGIWYNFLSFDGTEIISKSIKGLSFCLAFEIFILQIFYCFFSILFKENKELIFNKFLLILCFICAFLCVIDSFLLLEYRVYFNFAMANVIMGTTFRESLEFLQVYFWNFCALLLIFCFFVFILLFAKKYEDLIKIFSNKLYINLNKRTPPRGRERERENTLRVI